MGRSVAYNPEIQVKLGKISKQKNEVGLLIGQRTPQKDFIICVCKVPNKDEELAVKDETIKKVKATKKASMKKSSSSGEGLSLLVDEAWISQFAREVIRTLPGGFDILGIYVASSSEIEKIQLQSRELLYSVFKSLRRDLDVSVHQDISLGILLHICTTSNKFVCRTYDIKDARCFPNPAEWKPLSLAATWLTLASQVSIDFKFPVKREDCDKSVKKQIEAGLLPFFKRVLNALPVINKTIRQEDELLVSHGDTKKAKQKNRTAEQMSFNVDLVFPLESDSCSRHSTTTNCEVMFTCRGLLTCRAFVHNKATVKEAVKALQQDIIRSTRARCDINFTAFPVIEEEQEDPVVVYELPKRVFAPLSGVLVCDYQFVADTDKDSLGTFKELLDLELSEEDILSLESFPHTSTLILPQVSEDRLSEFGDVNTNQRNMFFPMAGAAIAAVTAGISYLLLWPQHS